MFKRHKVCLQMRCSFASTIQYIECTVSHVCFCVNVWACMCMYEYCVFFDHCLSLFNKYASVSNWFEILLDIGRSRKGPKVLEIRLYRSHRIGRYLLHYRHYFIVVIISVIVNYCLLSLLAPIMTIIIMSNYNNNNVQWRHVSMCLCVVCRVCLCVEYKKEVGNCYSINSRMDDISNRCAYVDYGLVDWVGLRLGWSMRVIGVAPGAELSEWSMLLLGVSCAKRLSCIGRWSCIRECVSNWFCVVKLMLPNGFSYINDDDEDVSCMEKCERAAEWKMLTRLHYLVIIDGNELDELNVVLAWVYSIMKAILTAMCISSNVLAIVVDIWFELLWFRSVFAVISWFVSRTVAPVPLNLFSVK